MGVIIINAQGLHRSSLMSIWNKMLVWVIGVASVALFYMAARTLKTHQYWRELAQKYERKIEQVQQQNRVLLEGGAKQDDQTPMGIRQRRIELNKLLLDRHRVWSKCEPKVKLNQQTARPNHGRHRPARSARASPRMRSSTGSRRPTCRTRGVTWASSR